LDITNEQFDNEFAKIAKDLQAHVALDCIAGPLVGRILKNLPKYGMVVNYGTLSGQSIGGIDAADMRFLNKRLQGFVVFEWLQQKNNEEREKVYQFVRENLNGLFRTNITGRVPIENFKEGFKQYKNSMSAGKVLLILSDLIKK